jgi:hypothetical protein
MKKINPKKRKKYFFIILMVFFFCFVLFSFFLFLNYEINNIGFKKVISNNDKNLKIKINKTFLVDDKQEKISNNLIWKEYNDPKGYFKTKILEEYSFNSSNSRSGHWFLKEDAEENNIFELLTLSIDLNKGMTFWDGGCRPFNDSEKKAPEVFYSYCENGSSGQYKATSYLGKINSVDLSHTTIIKNGKLKLKARVKPEFSKEGVMIFNKILLSLEINDKKVSKYLIEKEKQEKEKERAREQQQKENGGAADNMLWGKPVIYLYPEKEKEVKVQLDYTGKIFADYPQYNQKISGWEVIAYPDGKIINKADNLEYSYLFWEGILEKNIAEDISEGFVVSGNDSRKFLREKLSYLGLTPKEYNEFIVYWYPVMQKNKYNLVYFAGEEYIKEAKLTITPTPDSMLRVFMIFKPLEEKIEIKEQKLEKFEREGFSVVEWGGMKVK